MKGGQGGRKRRKRKDFARKWVQVRGSEAPSAWFLSRISRFSVVCGGFKELI